jgi:ligand-binding sensor domain-containing protein
VFIFRAGHGFAVLALVLLAASSAPVAQEYGFDVWTTANGLLQNTVTGVAQTPDGYLRLSTFDGLEPVMHFARGDRQTAST